MAKPNRTDQGRPDPDALLALSHAEGRGRLKIFLGAAPGVGKTYAMLQGAQRLKAEGVDVVIGLAETHGRKETGALLAGLEILPRRSVDYRGRTLEEFDIDAALARRPALLVLDELAHTNAPDSRHPKRWQDAQELLSAGINVWSALNIQHLESLADVVSRITGIAVRETIPDIIIQDADDIVLVDITPDELIARLHEGKIYLPETAQRATNNFFTPGNLTALRELALRRTADRVDDQMVDYLRQKAIEGPWGSSERLLACVGADEGSARVVRRASQLATSLNASWLAVHIEIAGENSDPDCVRRMSETLQLVERLGGEVTRIDGGDVAAKILHLARNENITQIVIGRSNAGFRKRLFGRSLADALMLDPHGIEIHVVQTGDAPRRSWWPNWLRNTDLLTRDVLAASVAVVVATGIGEILAHWLKLPNLSMVFLVAVLVCAIRFGTRAAVVASGLSFLAYNFFFIEPVYTLTIAEPHELLSLLIFLVVAILTGSLTGRIRDQSQSVTKNAAVTQSLYDFSRKISGAAQRDEVLWAAAAHLHRTFGKSVVLLIAEGAELKPWAAWPPDTLLDAAESGAAQWAMQKGEPAGWATGTLPNIRFQFRPLVTTRGTIGVCGIEPPSAPDAIGPEDERALAAILEQTAIALDRALLADEAVRAASLEENERVRNALLASLSHDLRTPLSAITGAATSLRTFDQQLSAAERSDLLASIEEETARLSRFIANLLDMSRIEAGGLKLKRDWVDVDDVVRSAIERCRKTFPGWPLRVSLAPGIGFVRGDARLLEQVLFNLLDNAQKYGGPAGAIVHGREDNGEIVLSVSDEGPGIKIADLERVFEKFWRGGGADGRLAGTGLGLSICRGLIEAMDGTIIAQSPAARRRGTRIVIRLPAAKMPDEEGAA